MTELFLCEAQRDMPEARCKCDNCGYECRLDKLALIKDAEERLCPGYVTPAGECPKCGALSYLKNPPKDSAQAMAKKPAPLSEADEIKRGETIAEMLGMKLGRESRYRTTWGTKTPLGLFRSVKRLIEDGK